VRYDKEEKAKVYGMGLDKRIAWERIVEKKFDEIAYK
jgi:hypothetical protein